MSNLTETYGGKIPHEMSSKIRALLQSAISSDGADMGMVHQYDPVRQTLNIVAQVGYENNVVKHFNEVKLFRGLACSRAASIGSTVIISDSFQDIKFFKDLGSSVIRAAKSIPVFKNNQLLGTITTHFKEPKWKWDLQTLDTVTKELELLLSEITKYEYPDDKEKDDSLPFFFDRGVKRNSFFFVKDQNGHFSKIRIEDILYIEGLGDSINICTVKKTLTVPSTMKHAVLSLPSQDFMMVHKSFIVNLHAITHIEDNLISIGDKLIPISSTYKNEVMEKINIL